MHQFTSQIKNQIKKVGATAFLAAIFISAPVAADHAVTNPHDTYGQPYETVQTDPSNPAFREANPFRVYIAIQTEAKLQRNQARRGARQNHTSGYDRNDARTRQGRHSRHQARTNNNGFEQRALRSITRALPHNIILVNSPRQADMTVRVRQQQYDMNFRIVDVDQKDKKYKKSRRYAGGPCGVHQRAFYTRVKEKGEAEAFYSLKFKLKGFDPYRNDIHIRSSEKFSYGKNLRARTNCGLRPTQQLPSKGVTKLFNRASPEYRHYVAMEIKREAAQKLGHNIARQIVSRSHQHYTALAVRLNHTNYYENQYSDAALGLATLITLFAKN
ncbi:MAG: hypothetical protein KUG56_01070 [Kordiimonadaceae bacterium]|nr:hypothetical protein [Kordiimonadaceae bacterium]